MMALHPVWRYLKRLRRPALRNLRTWRRDPWRHGVSDTHV